MRKLDKYIQGCDIMFTWAISRRLYLSLLLIGCLTARIRLQLLVILPTVVLTVLCYYLLL